jgi:hypothetical protein
MLAAGMAAEGATAAADLMQEKGPVLLLQAQVKLGRKITMAHVAYALLPGPPPTLFSTMNLMQHECAYMAANTILRSLFRL